MQTRLKKNTGECCTTQLKSTCKNSGTFKGKKISPEKVTYVPLAPSPSIIGQIFVYQYYVLPTKELFD